VTPATPAPNRTGFRSSQPFSGAVTLITGAGRGIGRAAAEQFARAGARLVLCSRTRKELEQTVATIRCYGGEAVYRVAEIASLGDVRSVVKLAVSTYGRLDVVINNAGILGPRVPVAQYPPPAWERVLRINLTGTFYVVREAARVMMPRRRGCLIMISSSVGRMGRAQWGAYAVSKFGVEGLAQVLAEELRAHGICVVTFNPGGTRTRMRAEAYPDEDPQTLPDPSGPAEALLHLARHATMAVTGQTFDLKRLPSAAASTGVSLTSRKSK
jgi:NAD(P)-dependent dehydrogenase (short-subunit alcohol dehydrogenase family)